MIIEKTLSIIKPDAVARNLSSQINQIIEARGFEIVAQKMMTLSEGHTKLFYAEHKERSFFDALIEYTSNKSVIVQVLQKEGGILDYRDLIGATNPGEAEEGTIRKKFGKSLDENSVHGSDSVESAAREIPFFFSQIEIAK